MKYVHKALRYKTAVFLASIICLAVLALPVFSWLQRPESIIEAWFDDNFRYRQRISFTHNAAITTARRISITFDTATLTTDKMKSDCSDTRFTDEKGIVLRYQLVSGCDSASTQYDVVFPNIVNGENVAYVYYGNLYAGSVSDASAGSVQSLSPSGGNPSVSSEEITPGPVSFWKLNEGYGQTVYDGMDNRQYGNLGTNNTTEGADPSWQTEDLCMTGGCLYFDGTDDVVTISDSSILEPSGNLSISLWLRLNQTAGSAGHDLMLVRKVHSVDPYQSYQLSIRSTTDTLEFEWNNSSDTSSVSRGRQTIVAEKWYHIAAVKNTSETRIYVNGYNDSILIGEPTGTLKNSDGNFLIGGTSAKYTKGFIDEVKLYPFALSAEKVRSEYNSRGAVQGVAAQFGDPEQQQFLSNGLVAYFKLNNASWGAPDCSANVTYDASGNYLPALACVATSGPVGGNQGKFGNGVLFDGSDDYLTVSSSYTVLNMTDAMTIAAWIKPTGASVDWARIAERGYSSGGYAFAIGSGSGRDVSFWLNNTEIIDTPEILTDSVWQHVAVTYDGLQATVYLNGTALQRGSYQGPIPGASSWLRIGGGSSGQRLNGSLDDLRMYNRALNHKEITDLYNWAPGPIAWWKFDENIASSAYDTSGNSNHSTTWAGAVWDSGKYGSALSFNGNNQVVRVAENTTTTNLGDTSAGFTVSSWFRTRANYSGSAAIIAKYNATSFAPLLLYLNSSEYACFTIGNGDGQNDACGSTALNDNSWHYITGVKSISPKTIYLYVDGILVDSVDYTSVNTYANDDDISIGNGGTSYTANDWNGQIDDARIYNYVRTQVQIVEDMNGGHPAPGSPVGSAIGHWDFEEGYGDTAHDQSASHNEGNLAGTGGSCPGASACPEWTNDGIVGRAMRFDGANDYIALTPMSGTNSFTASVWVYPSMLSDNSVFVSTTVGNNGWALAMDRAYGDCDGEELCVWLYGSSTGGYIDYLYDLPLHTWTHYAATFDGNTGLLTMYINGKKLYSETTAWRPDTSAVDEASIGRGDSGWSPADMYLNGKMDEVLVFNSALTAEQIGQIYNQHSGTVLGTLSTDSFGNASNSALRSYCPPGNTESNCAPGLDPAPVGEWKFDENGGTNVYDSSGNGNTMPFPATPPKWTNCILGPCLSYDGVTNYLHNGSVTSELIITGNLTISAWVFRNSVTADNALLQLEGDGTGNASNANYRFYINDLDSILRLYWTYGDSRTVEQVSSTVAMTSPTGSWAYLAAIRDETTKQVMFYENGRKLGGTVTMTNNATGGDNQPDLDIGASSSTPSNPFDGKIDQLRIFNYVLTPSQIAWDYNRGAPVAWYKFDECQGTTAYNSVKNANNQPAGLDGTITIGTGGTNNKTGSCTGNGTDAWYDGATGKYNSALNLDGSDDYVEVADNDALDNTLNNFTMSAWVKLNSITEYPIIGKLNGDATGYQMGITTNGTLSSAISDGTNIVYSSGDGKVLATGTWYHIAVVITRSGTMKRYVDGIASGKADSTSSVTGSLGNIYPLRIGADSQGYAPSVFAYATVDDVRIYSYPLSQTQIVTAYNEGAAVRFGPLTGSP